MMSASFMSQQTARCPQALGSPTRSHCDWPEGGVATVPLSSAACPPGRPYLPSAGEGAGGCSTLPAAHGGCCTTQAETADSRFETTMQGFEMNESKFQTANLLSACPCLQTSPTWSWDAPAGCCGLAQARPTREPRLFPEPQFPHVCNEEDAFQAGSAGAQWGAIG